MIKYLYTLLTIVSITAGYSQSKEEKQIVEEGKKLYQSEMASWYGTDLFFSKFAERREHSGGYFSYIQDKKAICVFYSAQEDPKVIASFSFDSTYDVNTAVVSGEERKLTTHENALLAIRNLALNEFKTDTLLFKMYKDMSPNFIPIVDDNGKRVYILTGPQKPGIVVFGNDYLLTFDKKNKLKEKKHLHKNLIVVDYAKRDDKEVIATMHTHLPETGALIIATDICTLMLYERFAQWGQHYVISEKSVSLWDCKNDRLVVLPREIFDRMNNSPDANKK
jgi:hypothetical protein